jgi:hypothetical protein
MNDGGDGSKKREGKQFLRKMKEKGDHDSVEQSFIL